MNSIISFPKLIELLSRATSQEKSFCEKFVHVFSVGVKDALGAGEAVRLKGFGQFRVDVTDGIRKAVFIPDKEMADAINAPFACFEPVELAPGVSADTLAEVDEEAEGGGADMISVADFESEAEPEPVLTETDPTEQENPVIDFGIDTLSVPNVKEETIEEEEDDDDPFESLSIVSHPIHYNDDRDGGSAGELSDEPENDLAGESFDEQEDISRDIFLYDQSENTSRAPVTFPVKDEESDDSLSDSFEGKTPVLQSGMSLLTPEARSRHEKAAEKAKIQSRGFPWFWVAIAYVGGMAIGFSLGFFGHGYITGLSDEERTIDLTDAPDFKTPGEEVLDLTGTDDGLSDSFVEEPVIQAVDTVPVPVSTDSVSVSQASASEPPSQQAQNKREPVYDTVTPNRYLTTMAVEHYGNKVFWVYIFLDNQDKIKNPNNVVVGTKLRIPPKEQYDVSQTDEKANIEAAKRKQTEIYNKYGNQ